MKLKHYSFLLFLLLTTAIVQSQNQKKIYSVTIFKWSKNEDGELKQFMKIDSIGNVFFLNQKTGKKINLKSFTKSVNNFITDKDVEKVNGSDDPPRVASIPKSGKQNVYITVTFLEDFHNETQLATITSYHCKKENLKHGDCDYVLYNYLGKKDLEILKTFLK